MNPMLDLFRIRGKKALSTSKFAVLIAGTLIAGAFAWFIVPWLFRLMASTIPTIWTSIRSSTAPPYLFIAVNFIILTIWKLSENRTLHSEQIAEEESPFSGEVISLRSRDLVSSQNPELMMKTSVEDFGKSDLISGGNAKLRDSAGEGGSESSGITKVSEEKSTACSSSNGGLVSESAVKSIYMERKGEKTVVDGRDETDSLDDTWNAIAGKSERWERSKQPLTAGKGAVQVAGDGEIDQRFEDFIKKNHYQIRLRKPG